MDNSTIVNLFEAACDKGYKITIESQDPTKYAQITIETHVNKSHIQHREIINKGLFNEPTIVKVVQETLNKMDKEVKEMQSKKLHNTGL